MRGQPELFDVDDRLKRLNDLGDQLLAFAPALRQAGYIAMGGQIVDASLVAAPKQRNTDDEKDAIKQGRIPKKWKAKPAKLRQQDRDARRTV
jgi:transposase, IS5 family